MATKAVVPEQSITEVKEEVSIETKESKPKFDPDELLVIFDEIIFSGEYREDITIKNKLKVTFRSRSADDTTSISKEMDSGSYSLISTLQERTAFLNVIYSVIFYAGKDLSNLTLVQKKDFFGKLPAVIIGALSEALIKFDSKVAAACFEGEENF